MPASPSSSSSSSFSSSRSRSRPSTASSRSSSTSPVPHRHEGAKAKSTNLLDVFQTRKAWKKSGANGERIWPEALELVLIEGLRAFKPDPSSRETTMLGRYPHRNKFISSYIRDKTGEIRTPKQVGSRLQQLREYGSESTEQGRMLQKLLSPVAAKSLQQQQQQDSFDDELDSDPFNKSSSPVTDPPVVWIDILPKSVAPSAATGDARPIEAINPTVAFVSETLPRTASIASVSTLYDIETQSSVFRAGGSLSFETEQDGRRIYIAPLAPGFWNEVIACDDPTRFAIDLYVADRHSGKELLRVVYRFQFPAAVAHQVSAVDSPVEDLSPTAMTFAPSPSTVHPSQVWSAGVENWSPASPDGTWPSSNGWGNVASAWSTSAPDFAPSPTSSSGTDSGWSDEHTTHYISSAVY